VTNEEAVKADFRKFMFLVWKHLGLPAPTPTQYQIAYFLQHGPKRRMVQAFRGVGKSWITAAFCLWHLYRNPAYRIVVVSAAKERAEEFTTFCRDLLRDMPLLQHLCPSEDESRKSRFKFDVAGAPADQQPSLSAYGIGSALTGRRADLIVPDDVEVLNNSASVGMRAKLNMRISEFSSVLKPGGDIVFLGTPQGLDSIYNGLPARGFTVRKWYARYPSKAIRESHGVLAAPEQVAAVEANPELEGHTTEPTRFSDEDLAKREMDLGPSTFALQFMLDTTLADVEKYPLRMRDLLVWPLSVEGCPDRLLKTAREVEFDYPSIGADVLYWADKDPEARHRAYQGVVMAIDPGGRGKDETAYAVVAHSMGILYLLDSGAVSGYGPEALEVLADVVKTWKVRKVLVESNMGDGMFASLLQPVVVKKMEGPVSIEDVRHSVQKELRIADTLEPLMAQSRLVVNSTLFEKDRESVSSYALEDGITYSLFYQMTRITRTRGCLPHDDRLDALQMACAYWVKSMAQDTEKARAQAQRQDQKKAIAEWIKQSKEYQNTHRPKSIPAPLPRWE
jgi:hypothetical protein